MGVLKQAYLVDSRKDGRWTYDSRPDGDVPPAAQGALAWVDASLANDGKIRNDAKRVKKILKLTPEELCKQNS